MTSSTSLLEWFRRMLDQSRGTDWTFKNANLGGC